MIILHKHNADTYKRIQVMFETEKRICCVQPTGTGKSFLILKLVEDHPNDNFIIASPSNYIFDQIQTHAFENSVILDNVKFITYAKLSQLDDLELYSKSDYIILDEFHRLGAKDWGNGAENLFMVCPNAKILGTSATPIRYLDSMRNMAEEIFNNNYAVNMTLAEAIRKKILPLPVYVTSIYQFSGDIAKLEHRATATKNPRLRMVLLGKIQKAKRMISDLECGLDDIFKNHIRENAGKYIIFCSGVEELQKSKRECRFWFEKVNSNIHAYCVHSQNPSSMFEFEMFKNDSDPNVLKLLFCVDMLNEGVHVNGVDGVIMLRATQSANVFYQQLGRALSCSSKSPVIFDIVNNFETGDTAKQYASIMEISRRNGNGEADDIEVELYDYVRDIRDILDEIHDSFENVWEYNYELLIEFKNKYERFPVNDEIYKGIRLAAWCNIQKNQYKNGYLSEDRIEKLNMIGFSWFYRDNVWYANFLAAKSYKEKNGEFPKNNAVAENEKAIFNWLKNQRDRYREGCLSEEKIELLKSIGFKLKTVSANEAWQKKYEQLASFVKSRKKFPSVEDFQIDPDLKPLRQWMTTQRVNYKADILSQERIKKLNEIHFIWDTDRAEWVHKFSILKKFVNTYQHFPKRSEKYENIALGQWYTKQLGLYRNDKLEAYQKETLESLDRKLLFYEEEVQEYEWILRYDMLVKFLRNHGRTPAFEEKVDGVHLYDWLMKQKKKAITGELSEDKIMQFKEIGIDILNFKTIKAVIKQPSHQWMDTYNRLLDFLQIYHRLPVSNRDFREENLLYVWSGQQKRRFINGKLSEKQVELLKNVNVL